MTNNNLEVSIRSVVVICAILPLSGFILLELFLSGITWQLIPLHIILESLGIFLGLILAMFILSVNRATVTSSYQIFAASALIAMGILDGFSCVETVGISAGWEFSFSMLVGGFLFALIWVNSARINIKNSFILPSMTAVLALALGFLTIFYTQWLPTMTTDTIFSHIVMGINILAGGFFFVGAGALIRIYYTSNHEGEVKILTGFCLLNGIATLMFPLSPLWSASFWFWHLLRICAYILLVTLIYYLYQKTELLSSQRIRESEEKFHTVADFTYDWEYWESPQQRLLYVSPSCERITGYSSQEFMENPLLLLEIIHPEDRHLMDDHLSTISENPQLQTLDFRIIHRDGEIRWIAHGCQQVTSSEGRSLGRRVSNRDITDRKRSEEKQYRLNRELRAISACNQTLLRADDEQVFLQAVCQIICDEAGYRLTWIGYADDDDAKTIRPVAWAGYDSEYVKNAQLSWSEKNERGQGPAGIAIRTGNPVLVQDFITDHRMGPWRDSALKRGYRSGIALPIKGNNSDVFAVLMIYSTEPDAFTPDEIRLIEGFAGDVAFGIMTLQAKGERRRVQNRLNKRDKQLNEAQHIAHIGSWELDINLNILEWSDEVYQILEIDPAESKPDFELYLTIVHPNDREKVMQAYRDSVKYKNRSDITYRLQFPDNRYKYVHERVETFYDEENRPVRSLGTIQDITERKENVESLKESEERFRLLVEQSPLSIQILTPDGRTVQVNQAFENLWGIALSDLEHYNILSDSQLEDLGLMPFIRMSFAGEVVSIPPAQYDGLKSVGIGKKRWVQSRSYPIRDRDGNIHNVIIVHEDITEQKEAEEELLRRNEEIEAAYEELSAVEEELRSNYKELMEKEQKLIQSERKYRAIFDQTFQFIGLITPDGRLREINRTALEFSGVVDADVIGKFYWDTPWWSHSKDQQELLQNAIKKAAKGEFIRFEAFHPSSDGTLHSIDFSLKPVLDEDGQVVLVIPEGRDISERKSAEEALNQATKKLSLLNSIVFQDIQNAIFSLSGYLELENEFSTIEDLRSFKEKEVSIIQTIAQSLKFADHYQSLGIKPPAWQSVIQSFLYGISHLNLSHLDRRLEVENLEIYADPLFENVFFTLAENVILHGTSATAISLWFQEQSDGLLLIFEDNGGGIPVDMKLNIFSREYEEKKGMGLFLTREILSITGLSILETGEFGKGARFEIRVPKKRYRFVSPEIR